MRTYQHNLGDWAAHTQHLDWTELSAYHKLIEMYYLSEQALPNDLPMLFRVISAITKAERAATRRILGQFFVLAADGKWHQKRCDKEIEKAKEFREMQRGKINKRWNASPIDENRITNAPKSSVTENTTIPESLGWVNQPDAQRALTNANGLAGDTDGNTAAIPPVIPYLTPNSLNTSSKHTLSAIDVRARGAAAVCVSKGIQVEAKDPRLLALLADGATAADFEAAAPIATAAGRGWAYCSGIVANRLSDAARMAQEGPKTAAGSPNYPMLPRWYEPDPKN